MLESQAKDMPGLDDLFLRYKQLKKKLKSIPKLPDSKADECECMRLPRHAKSHAMAGEGCVLSLLWI